MRTLLLASVIAAAQLLPTTQMYTAITDKYGENLENLFPTFNMSQEELRNTFGLSDQELKALHLKVNPAYVSSSGSGQGNSEYLF